MVEDLVEAEADLLLELVVVFSVGLVVAASAELACCYFRLLPDFL